MVINKVVATSALMSITHILKVFVLSILVLYFFFYIGIIVAMIVGAVAGSWVGTQLRDKINGKEIYLILKVLLVISH